MTANLAGRRALVTGAASGIGYATAEMLARCGATVALNDLATNPALEPAVQKLTSQGLKVIAAPGNVGDPDDVIRMMNAAVNAIGGLDYLINNAATPGTRLSIPPADMDIQGEVFWDKLLDVNLLGPYRCIRAAKKYLKLSGGAVVNVASTAAFGGGGSSTAYATTKAGLVLMTRELAKGLGPEIRVNAIAPGWVTGTNWDCSWAPEEAAAAAKALPLGRVGEPGDFAEVILFLCASGGYITGQTIIVDGGLLA
ncbi:SDR family oxidoreductase [Sapientia aquatica]|uniref:SDR family oxidoreductase n=2 Tax=Sapientia aquatica TaxID=1549640 RepID=A0A4R5VQE3_9BURK|nr:SDR family oxidoreductase [Sapientia aquatica]